MQQISVVRIIGVTETRTIAAPTDQHKLMKQKGDMCVLARRTNIAPTNNKSENQKRASGVCTMFLPTTCTLILAVIWRET